MQKRVRLFIFMLAAAFLLSGMGGGKGGGFERAPRVEKNYAVTIIDASGIKIEGEKFSWEGRVHFSGYQGMAQVVIPFEKVRELTIGEKKERKVKVIVRLIDGKETVFDLDADSRCYGEAGYGSFMLLMDEVRQITFQ